MSEATKGRAVGNLELNFEAPVFKQVEKKETYWESGRIANPEERTERMRGAAWQTEQQTKNIMTFI